MTGLYVSLAKSLKMTMGLDEETLKLIDFMDKIVEKEKGNVFKEMLKFDAMSMSNEEINAFHAKYLPSDENIRPKEVSRYYLTLAALSFLNFPSCSIQTYQHSIQRYCGRNLIMRASVHTEKSSLGLISSWLERRPFITSSQDIGKTSSYSQIYHSLLFQVLSASDRDFKDKALEHIFYNSSIFYYADESEIEMIFSLDFNNRKPSMFTWLYFIRALEKELIESDINQGAKRNLEESLMVRNREALEVDFKIRFYDFFAYSFYGKVASKFSNENWASNENSLSSVHFKCFEHIVPSLQSLFSNREEIKDFNLEKISAFNELEAKMLSLLALGDKNGFRNFVFHDSSDFYILSKRYIKNEVNSTCKKWFSLSLEEMAEEINRRETIFV